MIIIDTLSLSLSLSGWLWQSSGVLGGCPWFGVVGSGLCWTQLPRCLRQSLRVPRVDRRNPVRTLLIQLSVLSPHISHSSDSSPFLPLLLPWSDYSPSLFFLSSVINKLSLSILSLTPGLSIDLMECKTLNKVSCYAFIYWSANNFKQFQPASFPMTAHTIRNT